MKIYKKKEMLSIVDTLAKVNESIISSRDRQSQGVDILVKCRNIGLDLAASIDDASGRGTVLISLLADYCEMVGQLCFALADDTVCQELTDRIQIQLSRLAGGITCEIPDDKKEVLFLPYKASMWDSLESVWKAADEDEECEAYVVPIPYFDKNPDGTFGEMHYEGDSYPSYVPVVSWKEYDIASRKPDVIYIHNPYDNCNYVTSVHPMFYAKELRKYTKMLVYISYFIAVSDEVEKGFCALPGTIYSHKVIVQSESVRQTYIEELHKLEEENNSKGMLGNIENKVLALGSPKYDKVRGIRKEELEIPPQWEKIIHRPDGTWKKIVLYNTSVAPFLAHSEEMLDKILDTFMVFKKSAEEIALLWRPHPLLPATIKSMRPLLRERYNAIVDQYINEGWGIYDDSGEVDRAILLSDAYYGDGGSVLELYRNTGKPAMVQDARILTNSAEITGEMEDE